uniref:Uncharacterized protein n=1 Tax=Aegilops tauschii subsp. strangulata TaxID=200361 RepID=A0A453AWM6_AEGTS
GQGRRGGHGGRGGDPERNRRPRWRTTMSPPSSHSLKNSTPLSPMLWKILEQSTIMLKTNIG